MRKSGRPLRVIPLNRKDRQSDRVGTVTSARHSGVEAKNGRHSVATRIDGSAGSGRATTGWGWLLAYGIASVVIGILAFLWPLSATIAATWGVAVSLIVAGVIAVAAGARAHGTEPRGYAIGFGILSVVLGIAMLAAPIAGAVSLTILVAIWLGSRGILEIGLGARYRRHRFAMIALGIVNILLAIYVIVMLPLAALTLPGFLLGVSFLSGGAVAIAQALAHR